MFMSQFQNKGKMQMNAAQDEMFIQASGKMIVENEGAILQDDYHRVPERRSVAR